ncbi:MAG TPA: YvcK family protein, partial [bacterium]|nr:YvcK family protein [bacterium]
GSNRVVRDEFGYLPLSDLRKSIIALAEKDNTILRELFMYRFDKGEGLSGHTLGNLILMALTNIKGSEVEAVRYASELFNVRGKIIPVTTEDTKLVAKYSDGTLLKGEHLIDEPEDFNKSIKIDKLFLSPSVKPTQEAVEALKDPEYIIIGPGDLYTSILANIVVENIAETIRDSNAKIIMITNLMSKTGQTHNMNAKEFIYELVKYIGREPDIVIQNSGKILPVIMRNYQRKGEHELVDNFSNEEYTIIREDVIGDRFIVKDSGDTLKRSLVRHDPEKLGRVLNSIFTSKK